MSELIGKTVGQYQIVEQIGAGGMATIFKAYQPSIDRYVAVKVLPSQLAEDENFVKRFAHEAKAIAALEHPHILPVHDFGTDGKLNYMVMRYIKGGTLGNLMGKPMPYERIVQIVGDVAKALDYAHLQGVVHRDIKPSNILIDEHGEVLLTDFGIAKLVEGSKSTQLTAAGSILGTPAYMAPEQAQAQKVDGRSDIYSLGVVLYELLTGRPPYEAETPFAVVLKHINDPLPPPRNVNPDIPEALERVVLKAMAKDPDQRFETAGQMEQALQNARKEIEAMMVVPGPSTVEPKTMPDVQSQTVTPPVAKRSSMGPLLIGGAIVIALLCLLAGGGLVILGLTASSDAGKPVAATPPSNSTPEAGGPGQGTAGDIGEAPTATPPPTATPAATATPPPTDSSDNSAGIGSDEPDGETLFEDDFSSDRNDWFTGEEEDEFGYYAAEIADGLYRIYMNAATEDGNFNWVEPLEVEFDDFVFSVDVVGVEHSGDFGYGLIFRSSPEGDFYLFEIDNDGFIVLLALADDDWEVPIDYTATSAINPDGPNQLMVKAIGPSLSFFINGQEVATLEDDTLESGSIGLAVDVMGESEELLVEFDNLVVREATGQDEADISDEIIFAEYFNSDANGWATGQFEDEYSQDEVTIENGKYILSVTASPEHTPYIEKTLPNQEFSDFILTLQATPHDAEEHYSYGIAFRENFAGHTYVFEIGNDGLYTLLLFDGEWSTLKDWSSTDAIEAGQTNELMVIAEGNSLTFIVNGQILTTIEDDTLSEGAVGLVIDMFEEGTSATVDFDNLVIRPVGSQE